MSWKYEKDKRKNIKMLKKDIAKEYEMFKMVKDVPNLAHEHLYNIIVKYNTLYTIEKPSLADKSMFTMLKAQYRIVCALCKVKPSDMSLLLSLDGDKNGKP